MADLRIKGRIIWDLIPHFKSTTIKTIGLLYYVQTFNLAIRKVEIRIGQTNSLITYP